MWEPAGLAASKIREPGKELGSPDSSHTAKRLASESNGKSHFHPVLV